MHRCAAACCDDMNSSKESVQNCVKNCQSDVVAAQNYVQRELSNFENKLQRCAMDCQDKVREKVTPDTKPDQMEKFGKLFEDCAFNCVDSHVHSMSSLTTRMKNSLKAKNYATNFL